MALLFIDGFDHYASDDTLTKWNSHTEEMNPSRISMVTGRFGGQALALSFTGATTGDSAITKGVAPATNEIFVGVAVKYVSNIISSAEAYVLIIYDDAGLEAASVYISSTGHIHVQRGTPVSASPLASSVSPLSQDTWYYVELRYVPSNTVGLFEVRVNGVEVINISGIDSTAGDENIGSIGIGSYPADAIGLTFDDLYVCDTSGSTNNTFLGDVRVKTLWPTGDTVEADFTPSSGSTRWEMVDDPTDIDDDTTYVESGGIGATDRFTTGSSGLTATIFGVQVNNTARKTDTESRTFVSSVKSGATEKEDTTTHTLTADYIDYTDIYEVDPNTSVAWTVSGVDNLEIGHKITG